MTAHPYIPTSGLVGKAKRLGARYLSRSEIQVNLDRPLVTFSFDDFPKSAATYGARQLEARGWRGTYFAAAGFAGASNHHGEMFDGDDLQRLAAHGHEIACHTHSHLDAAIVEEADFLADVQANAAALSNLGLTAPLRTFAFPFGEATPGAKRALGKQFSALRGVRPGINRGRCDRTLLRAVALDGGEAGLKRALTAIADIEVNPGWLIFYGHDIQVAPSDWGCTPDFYDTVLTAASDLKCDVKTFSDAIDYIEETQR